MIVLGVAPIARLTPNSLVLSLTVMSIMFMIPIAPAKRANPPKTNAINLNAPNMVSISSNELAIVQCPNAVLSSG